MEPPQQIQARQTAYIVQIKDILTGKFVKEEGWNPNYVIVGNTHVSRVNIIGIIISVNNDASAQTMQLDDGTGKITLRNFEKKYDINVGEIVLCVGRVRQYNNETYLTPEIINKKVNKAWNLVWKKLAIHQTESSVVNKVVKEEVEETEEPISDSENVLSKIKELDDGNGAPYEEILAAVGDEKIISHLLLQGEIFEIKPGRLKVLE